jgi:hypothetical protein
LPDNGEVSLQAPLQAAPLAVPLAVLQPGEYPLWFQLTEDGPLLLESMQDALFSAALVPWPLALHVRFFEVKGDELFAAINRDGFIKLAPYSGAADGLGLYRFCGGEYWRQYTIGGFILYADKPAALLYLDDRFLDSDSPLPSPRAWTFSMESNTPFPLDIPALNFFPTEEGWDIDTLRSGSDGFWYYRAAKRGGPQPEIRMLRTASLAQTGEDVSMEVFWNSAPRSSGSFEHLLLPHLPDGFCYTGAAQTGDYLFVSWEEQEEFFIGAAGFMIYKHNP